MNRKARPSGKTRVPHTDEELKARADRIRQENPELAAEWDKITPSPEDQKQIADWHTKRLQKNLLERYPHLEYAEPTGKEVTTSSIRYIT